MRKRAPVVVTMMLGCLFGLAAMTPAAATPSND